MKYKFLLLLLLIPQFSFAYYVCYPCCSRFQLPGWWGSVDYMLLWRKPRFFPPLVTTNPTLPPALDVPGTTILFGNERKGNSPKSGGRTDLGVWGTPCLGGGIGFFFLPEEKIKFRQTGSPEGLPIFGRPFFNTVTGMQDVVILSFPALPFRPNGFITIDSVNRLMTFDTYLRYRFLSCPCFKLDLLGGYEYNSITDNLDITARTDVSLLVIPPFTVSVNDHFGCENQFSAGLVGFITEWRSASWALMVTGKVGLGNLSTKVKIDGTTLIIAGGGVISEPAGLLAQPSNIGIHKSTKFEIVPQIDVVLQLKFWCHFWATLGYTYMFWPGVALAGEQVDLNINPTQVPGPPIGPPAPIFHDNLKSFWVQGLTAGLYVQY